MLVTAQGAKIEVNSNNNQIRVSTNERQLAESLPAGLLRPNGYGIALEAIGQNSEALLNSTGDSIINNVTATQFALDGGTGSAGGIFYNGGILSRGYNSGTTRANITGDVITNNISGYAISFSAGVLRTGGIISIAGSRTTASSGTSIVNSTRSRINQVLSARTVLGNAIGKIMQVFSLQLIIIQFLNSLVQVIVSIQHSAVQAIIVLTV